MEQSNTGKTHTLYNLGITVTGNDLEEGHWDIRFIIQPEDDWKDTCTLQSTLGIILASWLGNKLYISTMGITVTGNGYNLRITWKDIQIKQSNTVNNPGL